MKRLSFKSPPELLVLCVFSSLLLGVADSTTPFSKSSTPTPAPTESLPPTTPGKPPGDVGKVTVVSQTEVSIGLKWDKVDNIATYELHNNGINKTARINEPNGPSVEYLVSQLTAGTLYSFTVFTMDGGLTSKGTTFTAPTAPKDVLRVELVNRTENNLTLQWERVGSISTYTLKYDNNEINITDSADRLQTVVSDLTAGTKYWFTLFTVFENVKSNGYTFFEVTAPKDVLSVELVNQDESSIALQWGRVDNISTYTLKYDNNEINITDSADRIQTVVSDLTAGTKYWFTLFTVFENVKSNGYTFFEVTAPKDVLSVELVNQDESSIALQWGRVDNISTYTLKYDNNEINITDSADRIQTVVSDLTAGTKYWFTLFTVFENVKSNGYTFFEVTAPKDVLSVELVNQDESSIALQWGRVDNISTYTLKYDNNEINITDSTDRIQTVVSDLTAGTRYLFSLFTVFENVKSNGYTFSEVTAPKDVLSVELVNQDESSIALQWGRVDNISTYTLKYDNNEINITDSTDRIQTVVPDLTAGTKYSFTLFTVFENVSSRGYTFSEVTAPRNTKRLHHAGQHETNITLEWETVDRIHSYILVFDEERVTIDASQVSITISNLTSGEKYNFTLFTQFENVNSSGAKLTAVTAPRDVQTVTVVSQTETNITLEWVKVGDSFSYILEHGDSNNVAITDGTEGGLVTHTVPLPDPGRKYNFTLYTVFEYANSKGNTFTASTVPPAVDGVTVTNRSLTSITLQWKNANNDWRYQIELNRRGDDRVVVPHSSSGVVSHTVQRLSPGTKYTLGVVTLFENLESKPFEVVTPTVIDCSSGTWQITSTSINATVPGEFTGATIKNKTGSPINTSEIIFFMGLYPGETYKIVLEYELPTGTLPQCERQLTLFPSDLVGHCEYEASGYSVRVVWDEPHGVCTHAEVNVSGERHVSECEKRFAVISGFEPAKTYQVSLGLLSGDVGAVRSQKPLVFDCNTDPRGVIAGSVMAVLIFIILVCVALFIFRKRPDIIRGKKPFIGGSKLSIAKAKAIPVLHFHSHFSELSLDEDRGFRQEYDSLSPVGREQTQKVAELQENAVKNRFTNVLPYDWNRVKLTTSDIHEGSDYINASYMPGYKKNREYIATQGPLPATLNDFWGMIWEQQVKRIVMVTNCTELGRTKCEQYWPPDGQSRIFKELSVTTTSEQQEHNWTLRNFSVKHRNTAEERTVRHFHFTAWPDHGVPHGTDVLIQFRGLMRQDIETDRDKAPTVVHCSAGVGRTGTIIALDVLLQQLEKEQSVGINAFVHQMRLNRPYMVQTESQYVFLHQCIMDSLQPKKNADEHIYENSVDMIYVNATALQELRQKNINT